MTTLASLALLPTVNALDLSGPGDGLYERFKILATEAGAGSESVAEREQLDRLMRGSGIDTDANFLSELESAAIASKNKAYGACCKSVPS